MRGRKWLIATGAPLAILSLGWGIWHGGIFAALSALGAYTAMQVIDLYYDRS